MHVRRGLFLGRPRRSPSPIFRQRASVSSGASSAWNRPFRDAYTGRRRCIAFGVASALRREAPGLGKDRIMGFGRGILLWLLGIPIPVIILLALFWHH